MKTKIMAVLFCLLTVAAFAQKGKAKRSSAYLPCGSFSFNIIGDNHITYPLNCDDSVIVEVRCAHNNEWHYLRFPVNTLYRSTGNAIAWGGYRFMADANGSARIVFNWGDCTDELGNVYAPTPLGYDVIPGNYRIELYWWGSYNPTGTVDIVIE